MRDPARIDPLIEVLRRIWKANPNLRMCQIIYNIMSIVVPEPDGDVKMTSLFYLEDDKMLKALLEYEELTKALT